MQMYPIFLIINYCCPIFFKVHYESGLTLPMKSQPLLVTFVFKKKRTISKDIHFTGQQ